MGATIFLFFLAAALLAGQISTHVPTRLNPPQRLKPPSAANFLGTDEFGRDVYSLVVHGSRVSLLVGGVTMLITSVGGTLHRTRRGLLPAPRPRRHALHGRPDGLPRDHPGHRLHGRAGPRRVERHPGAVARLPAADGPPGPEHRAEPAGARLRRGGAGARAARSGGCRRAHPAELSRAAPRPGDVHLRVRRPGGGDPGVPGRGRAAVRPLLGQRHREREERDPRGVLGQPLPGHHLDSGRSQPEPPGRRPS